MIFGIKERDGVAESAPGLANIDADKEMRRIEDIAMRGLDPRILNIHSRAIAGFSDGPVILMRIPKSFMSPHAVLQPNGDWVRFYTRSSRNNQILDIPQIRSAFLMSESLSDRMQKFQRERLARIIGGETPIPLPEGVKLVIHALPFTAFDPTSQTDIARAAEKLYGNIKPPFSFDWNGCYNLDGYLAFDKCNYAQIYRKGIVEAVGSYRAINESINKDSLGGTCIEKSILCALADYLDCLKLLSIEPPISLMLALLNVKDKFFVNSYSEPPARIDRGLMILPELTIQDIDTSELDILLKPTLDILWQSCGYQESPNYDENGRHISR